MHQAQVSTANPAMSPLSYRDPVSTIQPYTAALSLPCPCHIQVYPSSNCSVLPWTVPINLSVFFTQRAHSKLSKSKTEEDKRVSVSCQETLTSRVHTGDDTVNIMTASCRVFITLSVIASTRRGPGIEKEITVLDSSWVSVAKNHEQFHRRDSNPRRR
jgi:hypothetical protein